jgi:predicted ABC-type ATPase
VHQPSADPPVFLIIAGPNGSGKSTVAEASIEHVGRSVWIINPDVLAARIRDVELIGLDEANLAAVQRIEGWLEASIKAHQTVGVETVLSTSKYRRLVKQAKELRFEVYLVYVMLDAPQRNVERVRLRVEKGGHAVPEKKIIERYARSLQQLPWFLEAADRAWIFDNSSAAPKLVAEKADDTVNVDENAPPAILRAVGRNVA